MKECSAIPFLEINGFEKMEENSYANEFCNVVITDDGYEVADNQGYTMYSTDLNIYWLIGYLIYNKFINANFKPFI